MAFALQMSDKKAEEIFVPINFKNAYFLLDKTDM